MGRAVTGHCATAAVQQLPAAALSSSAATLATTLAPIAAWTLEAEGSVYMAPLALLSGSVRHSSGVAAHDSPGGPEQRLPVGMMGPPGPRSGLWGTVPFY